MFEIISPCYNVKNFVPTNCSIGQTIMLATETLTIPLSTDQDGVIRVGKTRVRLDTVIYSFNEGAIPEEIISQYPVLDLEDIYAVVAYYMKNRAEIDTYIRQREKEGAQIRKKIEAKPEYQAFRDRLLARRAK